MKRNRQNPLVVITLFSILSEAFVMIALKFLPYDIQKIFVWFAIGFPILIVILFFIVLYKKPENYYSPDYDKSNKNFIQAVRKILDDLGNEIVADFTVPQKVREKVQQKIDLAEEQLSEYNQEKNTDMLQLTIDGTKIEANTVKSFYRQIFEYLVKNDIEFEHLIPYKIGGKRYLISRDGKHANGKDFYAPLIFDGNIIETDKNNAGAKSDIVKFLAELELTVEN